MLNLFQHLVDSMYSYFVYILTNQSRTVFYTGVTGNLINRLTQHQDHTVAGFSYKYNVTLLVYYEEYPNIDEAIQREKQIKNWHRPWKLNLIRTINPELKDLSKNL